MSEIPQTLGGYQALIADDAAAGYGQRKNHLWILVHLISNAGLSAIAIHRLAYYCYRQGAIGRGLAKIIKRFNIFLNSCDIDSTTPIGPGFFLPHPVGIVIGPGVIGHNVTIHQNVTLGMREWVRGSFKTRARPNIGDDVFIYAGAVLVGGIKIGKGAVIGANAVVLQDVPEGCRAVGVPARILPPRQS